MSGTGRFAPSPTSDLHVGNLRTALLAWVFARATGRAFVVRIEDLDQARVGATPDVTRRQLDDLAALGLDGDAPPVVQSERRGIYHDAIARLDTYECFCTRAEIAQAASAPHRDYRPYPGTCSRLSPAERAARRATGRVPALRVRAGGVGFTVHDRHAGTVTRVVDDFVLLRGDGTPAYNLASVVDDGLSGVDQVVRGADLLDSAPRQAWLATRLGFVVPEYVHVGMAVNRDGVRLAKRDGAVTLRELAALGHLPGDVVAMLCASLGWPEADSAPAVLAHVRARPGLLDAPGVWTPWVVDPGRPTTPTANRPA